MASNTSETIAPEEARQQIATQKAQAVDLRGDEAWDDAHVPGSVRVAPDELDSAAEELDSDQGVILIADDESAARKAAETLRERGFEASVLEGGMDAWKSEDFTIQPSDDPGEEEESGADEPA